VSLPTAAGLTTALQIGPLVLDRRLFMAPMAGITSSSFRRSVRRWGAGLVFTEMIAAAGIVHENRRTLAYLEHGDDEHPLGFQLLGGEAETMARAADVCLRAGADLLDVNLACPVAKVLKTGAGAALLGQPQTALAIVRSVLDAAAGSVPVTVKLRAGLRDGDRLGVELAPRLAEAGAAAVCLHPRSAAQLYHGAADHALTRELCGRLSVPVIASGDVLDRGGCDELLAAGAAAVMVARGALGRPWVFTELLGGPTPADAARLAELRRFVGDVAASMGERAVGYLRQFWPRFRRSGTIDRDTAAALMVARHSSELVELLAI